MVINLVHAEDKWVWSDKLQDRSDDAPKKHNVGTKTTKRKPLQDELDDLENDGQGTNMYVIANY